MELLRFEHDGHDIGIRDIEDTDIPQFVSYWHDGVADLAFLGIDPEKLGSRAETANRLRSYRRGGPNPEAVAFTFFRDDAAIGYTNVNIQGRPYGYLHVHLTDERVRRSGVVSAILQRSVGVLYEDVVLAYGLRGVVLETRTRNAGINRVLTKAGFVPDRTEFLEDPDGLAGPGEFNVSVLERDVLQSLAAKSVAHDHV